MSLPALPEYEVLFKTYKESLERMDRSGNTLFVTGKAGTGKSTLLRLYCMLHPNDTIVLAPTGIAAINCGGVTIHSFFGLPFRPIMQADEEIKRYGKNHPKHKLISKVSTIIIDEISMVRADILDAIDYSLRINTGLMDLPFGGKKMVFIGDMFQLEPVVKNTPLEYEMFQNVYDSPYFFSARVMQEVSMEMLELTRVFRQQDPNFIGLLDNIRNNELEETDIFNLNQQQHTTDAEDPYTITLATTNSIAQLINDKHMNQLPEPDFYFPAVISGEFNRNHVSADEMLRLRIGAQVVFLKNDASRRWVNGSIGRVTALTRTEIKVTMEDGTEYELTQADWENNTYRWDEKDNRIKSETLGTFKQYPIKAAWAITIHKSQGLTFDRVNIDLGKGTFAHGQLYVALSRARSLEGLKLNRPVRYKDVIVDERVIDFMSRMRRNRA